MMASSARHSQGFNFSRTFVPETVSSLALASIQLAGSPYSVLQNAMLSSPLKNEEKRTVPL